MGSIGKAATVSANGAELYHEVRGSVVARRSPGRRGAHPPRGPRTLFRPTRRGSEVS